MTASYLQPARVFWLDAVRFIAIILVVFTHAHEAAGVQGLNQSVFYTIDRLGVPLFFMLSGALALTKAAVISPLSFYKKRIIQFIVLLVIYSITTNTIMLLTNGKTLVDAFYFSLINKNGITNGGDYGGAIQLWFMYAIIELYLIAPFLSRVLKHSKSNDILLFLVIIISLNQVANSFRISLFYKLGNDFTGAYAAYLIIGYLIINRNFLLDLKAKNKILLGGLLFSVPAIALVAKDTLTGFNQNDHWYGSSIYILLSSVGLLILLEILFKNKKSRLIENISKNSFGIFLLHYCFIYIAKKLLVHFSLTPVVMTVFYFTIAFFCSWLAVYLMSKHKITRYLTC